MDEVACMPYVGDGSFSTLRQISCIYSHAVAQQETSGS